MAGLKLDALDADDLGILSAYCQDSLTKAAECHYRPREKRFVLRMNRFVWEKAEQKSRLPFFSKPRQYERRRAILDFGRVEAVKQSGVVSGGDAVLALLAIRFSAGTAPAGTIELVFAGDATIRLDVECVEARLTDEEAVWSTDRLPDHDRPGP